ncbi:serine/threonine protein kinase [Salinibacterium sp. NSLL150]|uniref:serine/threonine-protein kinase n=1 Tax=unclassified Salinibacterium TaxID=2632331 RepID=UPI0018CF90C0|nr:MULTISPECIES: serine/threonine-protein kinase [unclassified Salinibacterium]MBH0098328.1 serine/threonine protein kinase [Salinibacterium sp. NSLL35]MBH0101083.1 serine/threonine protein kinase [Salinibacterium sp. NSLL150]MBH0103842.1 serine/threonine protein kinase [Salinibacterium sp. NSLL16]MBH0106603.1 serine/threonine protein kinase [Salinibacterium sp. NSLL17]
MATANRSRSSSRSDDELIDTVIGGRYRITDLIGRGGMASVYRARDESLPREVALKLMLPGLANPDEIRRQRNEVETLAALNHHALVTLFDAVTETAETADRVFLVMEFVDGPNLREAMTAPLPSPLVAHLGADIAEALHYMHGRGVVHRDIKPANILLAPSELPDRKFHSKLADFGIARLVDGAKMTSTGTVIGSASYLSPEQARGSDALGPSDVYSLGLVLLEALTGQRAFPGSAVETIGARLNTPPRVPDGLSAAWREMLVTMTALDAEQRPLPMDIAVALRALAYSSEDVNDAEGEPTRSLVPSENGTNEATGLEPTKAYARVETQATEAWPAPEASESATVSAAAASSAVPAPAPAPKRNPRLSRHSAKRLGIVLATALVLTLGVVAWTTTQNQQATPSEPTSPSYPVVPGELGTHLEQLQESVEP